MSKFLLIIFLLVLSANRVFADDFLYGNVTMDELQMKNYDKNPKANAVILNEYGNSYISTSDGLRLMFEYHVKIKFFNSHYFNSLGNISIATRKDAEKISDIKGTTTYLDDNGNQKSMDLDPSKIFHINQNKAIDVVKFDMPDLQKGCVIEYKFTLETPYFYNNFKGWNFQGMVPKVRSEYHASIPAIYDYHISLKGALKLAQNNAEVDRDCFSYAGTKCDCSKLTYAMTDIPAFETEEYMTAPKNYMSAINFELSEFVNLRTGEHKKITKDWKDVDNDLKNQEYFGSQIKRKDLVRDRVKEWIAGKPDDMAKARAIYEQMQKTFKWNGVYSKFSGIDGIKKALEDHRGNIGDINLSLIAALNSAGLNTEAVLISTRDHGAINRLYPIESEFDYVVAKVNIGDKSYMLDASDPLLGFGMLPLHCMNDQGRVINFEKPSYWIDLVEPQKKAIVSIFDLTLQPDGKLKGVLKQYSAGYAGYLKRKAIKKFNSVDEYVESFDEHYQKLKILKSEITNLDSLDVPLGEEYEVEINASNNMDNNTLSFNPFIFGHTSINPFKLNERLYPVDMGMASESRYNVVLHLPDGFVLQSNPKDVIAALPNNGGRFLVSFTSENNVCNYAEGFQLNKALYSVEEYPYLKELYNKVIQYEGEEIVLKKK